MAKVESKRLSGVSTISVAVFEGLFMGILGLVVAVLLALENTFAYTEQSKNMLEGLSLGLGTGIFLIIVLPIMWFVIGAVIGAIHGWLYNYIATQMGGIGIKLTNDK